MMQKSKKVKSKAVAFDVFQFTGKNGKDLVAWVVANEGVAKAGGSYVDVATADGEMRIVKGDWLFKDADGAFHAVGDALFQLITGK